jgi:hypothetical protein
MNFKTIACTILFCLILSSCKKQKSECQTALPNELENLVITHKMKGWELYSWPGSNTECADWNYAILTGTNRTKTFGEVTSDSVLLKVTGKAQLKSLLSKFPRDEYISWIGENWLNRIWGQSYDLRLPSPIIQNEISEHCLSLGLQFAILH